MKVLLTGANGFVGQHLAHELREHGHDVVASDCEPPARCLLDITHAQRVAELVQYVRPDAIVNLAGIAHVPTARDKPRLAFEVNVGGLLNVLEGCRHHAPNARVLAVTSAEVYGTRGINSEVPITEDEPLRPGNFYAITKAAADHATLQFGADHGLHVMTARPQNHIGPGQSPGFVTPSFARQIAEQVAAGTNAKPLQRGNLDSRKNFSDVRDVARGYRLLLERGTTGQAYNLASDRHVRIGDILEGFYRLAGIEPNHERHDPYFRPTESAPILSIERIAADTGWTPEIPFEQTLADIYADAAAG